MSTSYTGFEPKASKAPALVCKAESEAIAGFLLSSRVQVWGSGLLLHVFIIAEKPAETTRMETGGI